MLKPNFDRSGRTPGKKHEANEKSEMKKWNKRNIIKKSFTHDDLTGLQISVVKPFTYTTYVASFFFLQWFCRRSTSEVRRTRPMCKVLLLAWAKGHFQWLQTWAIKMINGINFTKEKLTKKNQCSVDPECADFFNT